MKDTVDHSKMKLGRRLIREDRRNLRLSHYMGTTLPTAPVSVDWSHGISNWGMMLNDQLGDCTIAGAAHAIQVWTANLETELTLSDDQVLLAYEQWDGYNPSDPASDQGGVELDVLKNWRQQGLAGHALKAFAAATVQDVAEVRQAINLFGGIYIGLSLPLTAQKQAVWDVGHGSNGKPGSWGGHCVYVVGYDATGFTCITWGELKKMTVGFWKKYCDEAYALLSPDWIGAKGSPEGLALAQLEADLAAIR